MSEFQGISLNVSSTAKICQKPFIPLETQKTCTFANKNRAVRKKQKVFLKNFQSQNPCIGMGETGFSRAPCKEFAIRLIKNILFAFYTLPSNQKNL